MSDFIEAPPPLWEEIEIWDYPYKQDGQKGEIHFCLPDRILKTINKHLVFNLKRDLREGERKCIICGRYFFAVPWLGDQDEGLCCPLEDSGELSECYLELLRDRKIYNKRKS